MSEPVGPPSPRLHEEIMFDIPWWDKWMIYGYRVFVAVMFLAVIGTAIWGLTR